MQRMPNKGAALLPGKKVDSSSACRTSQGPLHLKIGSDRTKINNSLLRLFDTQFLTPHLASLGAFEIPRLDYQALLHKALDHSADFGADQPLPSAQDVIQRNTQTS